MCQLAEFSKTHLFNLSKRKIFLLPAWSMDIKCIYLQFSYWNMATAVNIYKYM